jgi:hypothetical protein
MHGEDDMHRVRSASMSSWLSLPQEY